MAVGSARFAQPRTQGLLLDQNGGRRNLAKAAEILRMSRDTSETSESTIAQVSALISS